MCFILIDLILSLQCTYVQKFYHNHHPYFILSILRQKIK